MIKGMVGGNEKDITRIPMLDAQTQTYKDGWEVRDNNDNIVWGANRTLESDKSSINFKGYGLNLKDYEISGNMTQKGVETTINGVSPLNFTTNRDVIDYSISGNMTQSGVETTINGDGTLTYTTNSDLIDYSITGNMGQYKNSTVSGTSPLNFSTIIGGISDYSISGNMTYSGTPSTSSPIYPSECGNRTVNLLSVPFTNGYDLDMTTGLPKTDSRRIAILTPIDVSAFDSVTLSFVTELSNIAVIFSIFDGSDTLITRQSGKYTPVTIDTTNASKLYLSIYSQAGVTITNADISDIMLNSGSTALPYEPYGYKIPITCGGSTQNFYITSPLCKMGDYTDISSFTSNNITRKIKRLVLTGDETFDVVENKYYRMTLPAEISDRNNFFCSHFFVGSYSDGISLGQARGGGKPSYNFFFNYDNGSGGTTGFKNFLTTQYSAGTPVTVWYILESPETESATIPTITTVSGANTLSIGTTLAPTDISVTYAGAATPIYTTPIYPYETGDRTANLFDMNDSEIMDNYELKNDHIEPSSGWFVSNYIKCIPNTVYSIVETGLRIQFFAEDKTYISNVSKKNDMFTVPNNNNVYYFRFNAQMTKKSDVMVNVGSTTLPYEPYGYTLPVSHTGTGGNTQIDPIYLSEPIRKIGSYTDEVGLSIGGANRNIKKLILTGDENWLRDSTSGTYYTDSCTDYLCTSGVTCMCSHYVGVANASGAAYALEGISFITNPDYYRLYVKDPNFNSLEAFVAFLKGQNTNGTPVTVWYVLATPETETISMPTISNVNGENSLYIGTKLQPADISLTYSNTGNPTPTVPIYPYEVGDKTRNLFSSIIEQGTIRGTDGVELNSSSRIRSGMISVQSGASYTISSTQYLLLVVGYSGTTFVSKILENITGAEKVNVITIPNNADNVRFVWKNASNNDDTTNMTPSDISNIMLNTGSTALPYEPYGYKLPYSVNSISQTPIYLSEPIRKIGDYVDVTEFSIEGVNRKIEKIVLTGQETWTSFNSFGNRLVAKINLSDAKKAVKTVVGYCSHIMWKSSYTESELNRVVLNTQTELYFSFESSVFSELTIDGFKAYIASQYSAGTPVTVWYVLATPTTETITTPTIETVSGANTLSIDTSYSPSNISLTYSNTGNPTPTVPIYPYEVGDKTRNLFDIDSTTSTQNCSISNGIVTSVTLSTSYGGIFIYSKINLSAGTYYISAKIRYVSTDISNPWLNKINLLDKSTSPTALTSLTLYEEFRTYTFKHEISNDGMATGIFIQMGDRVSNTIIQVKDIMLSTANSDYEPYGIKLPITCAGTTKNVYLQEPIRKIGDYVDISGLLLNGANRRIKKMVLTGQESGWLNQYAETLFELYFENVTILGVESVSSHYIFNPIQSGMASGLTNGEYALKYFSDGTIIFIKDQGYTTIESWKSYLTQQYAAGTPVTIWYVLASEQTETTTMPTIQTTTGDNTFSITTSLQPSNIEITGHLKSHTVMTYIDYTDMTKSYTIGDANKVNAFTQRRRCNMLDDGTITAYYGDPTFVEDGSNGQVMVYQPKFYYKVEPVLLDGIKIRKCKYYISDYQLPGYKLHPAFIDRTDPNNLKEFPFVCIGAYEGCLQNGDTYITDDSASSTSYKLSSIAFTDTATNGVKPSSGVISPFGTIGNYETTASNRGTGWHIENIWIASMNQLMFVIEKCNPNSQSALGSGVVNISDTPNTANNSSLVGSTSSLGNGSGRATTTYSNYNGTITAQTATDKTAVSYRGMENPFGNIWKWVDGMTIKNTSATEHTPYICKSFAYTRNSTLTNYDMVNVTIPGNGYVTAFGYDPNFDWLFISAETNSSNTGSIRDYLYTTNSGYTCARLGSSWVYGAAAGLFSWALNAGSSDRNRNISARICYLPQ